MKQKGQLYLSFFSNSIRQSVLIVCAFLMKNNLKIARSDGEVSGFFFR